MDSIPGRKITGVQALSFSIHRSILREWQYRAYVFQSSRPGSLLPCRGRDFFAWPAPDLQFPGFVHSLLWQAIV